MVLLAIFGCSFDEHLPEVNIHGVVQLPKEAAIIEVNGVLVEDPRFIGPVFLGAFPSIQEDLYSYPHPEMGPVLDEGVAGNTYPYGGGTVGRFDYACFQTLACEVVTGRFKDYDDVLDFFANSVQSPVTDAYGGVVESPDYFRQYCYDLFEVTADYEISWISGEDGLDFVDAGDHYEAEYDMWQVEYFEGMQLWGWVDTPGWDPNTGLVYSTCDKSAGQQDDEYVNDFQYGNAYTDLLNFPGNYIGDGDYVMAAEDVVTMDLATADDFRASGPEPTLKISMKVGD